MKKNLTLLFITILFMSVFLEVADDLLRTTEREEHNLIAKPLTVAHYSTPEFQATARINRLGFRDHEYEVQKQRRYRVMVLGDSFTFGWGVDIENSWTKILEEKLLDKGVGVEVLNLGKSGARPFEYRVIAEKAIPLLRPDLVVIAVLQGDDLAQTIEYTQRQASRLENEGKLTRKDKFRRALGGIGERFYPHNIVGALRALTGKSEDQREFIITAVWKEQAENLESRFLQSEEFAESYNKIDGEIIELFLNGKLNPSLILLAVHSPDHFHKTRNLEKPEVQEALTEMGRQLSRIKEVAALNGARTIVVSMPEGAYVSGDKLEAYRRTGFELEPEDLTTNDMDLAIEIAAGQARLDFFEVTETFRTKSHGYDLFFELDGHMTPAGHQLYAESIEEVVVSQLHALNDQ